jgi:hypothetical protein
MTAPAGSGVTNKGTTYADGSQVTSTNLNDIVDDAVFNTNAVDDSTIGLNSSTPKALFVKNQGIDTAQIKDDAVTSTKLASNAVVTASIVNSNVTTAKIADLNVTTGKLANDAVTQAKIANDAVGAAQLASDAVVTASIVDANVTTAKIANDAVTPAKTSFLGTVDTTANSTTRIISKQSDGEYDSVTPSGDATMSQAGVITISDNAVDTAQIVDDAVTSAKIANNAVTTAKIADSNVTKAKIENVANLKVLGNTSGSAAAPQEVTINDTDNMSDASATTLATSESIKAYVDTEVANSFAPSIVFTSDGRNGESQRYYKNLTEIDDPNNLITINSTSEIEFASTGTYMIEAGIGLDDNDVSGTGDTYNIQLVKGNSSITTISFQGVTFANWSLYKNGTENKLVTFQVPYTVSNTTNDRLSIYASPVSDASSSEWEGFATIKITKIA